MDKLNKDEWKQFDQKQMIAEREKYWSAIFEKYNNMDANEEDDVNWDDLDRNNTKQYDDEEGFSGSDDEDQNDTDMNSDLEKSDSGTECIEVSDDDDCMAGFNSVFKEIAQERIQVIEKAYEEHYAEDYKNGDESRSVRRKTITRQKEMITTPRNMPRRMSKRDNAIMANNENGMALVKAIPSSTYLDPYHNMEVNEQIESDILENSGTTVLKKVTTTTTTTTTTTIIQHSTPKKDGTNKFNSKSAKKSHSSDEFGYDNDFSTPKSNRRTNCRSMSASKLNTTSGNKVYIPLTPMGKSNIVTSKQIKNQIDQIINEEEIDEESCQSVIRNVRVEKDKRLSLLFTPQKKAITASPGQAIDPMALIRCNQRPILVKSSKH